MISALAVGVAAATLAPVGPGVDAMASKVRLPGARIIHSKIGIFREAVQYWSAQGLLQTASGWDPGLNGDGLPVCAAKHGTPMFLPGSW